MNSVRGGPARQAPADQTDILNARPPCAERRSDHDAALRCRLPLPPSERRSRQSHLGISGASCHLQSRFARAPSGRATGGWPVAQLSEIRQLGRTGRNRLHAAAIGPRRVQILLASGRPGPFVKRAMQVRLGDEAGPQPVRRQPLGHIHSEFCFVDATPEDLPHALLESRPSVVPLLVRRWNTGPNSMRLTRSRNLGRRGAAACRDATQRIHLSLRNRRDRQVASVVIENTASLARHALALCDGGFQCRVVNW